MTKTRLEAFSDGVLAIIITIMVLELKVPHGVEWSALVPLWPVFLSYVLSFIYIGIYWNNHHHLMHTVRVIDGRVLWANLHLLFWLSLVPFVTGWMGENHFASAAVVLYGVVLLCAACAYSVLTRTLVASNGQSSTVAKALGSDFKGKISVVLYALAIGLSFWSPALGCLLYGVVAFIWLVPDRRMESALASDH